MNLKKLLLIHRLVKTKLTTHSHINTQITLSLVCYAYIGFYKVAYLLILDSKTATVNKSKLKWTICFLGEIA